MSKVGATSLAPGNEAAGHKPTSCEGTLLRLGELLDEEYAALENRRYDSIATFAMKKGAMLMEVQQSLEALKRVGLGDEQLAASIRKLRERIEINQRLLKRHLDAVNEIADLLSDVIRQAHSDGTYARSVGGRKVDA